MTATLTFAQAMPFIKADLQAKQTPALLGPPGIGKSSLIGDLARAFKTKVFTLACNQLGDRADLTGMRMVQDDSGVWSQMAFPHFKIMAAVKYAEENPNEEPILFMDEFNRASHDITSAVLSFQTERSIGSVEFPDNLRIIVAGNDKGNVTSLDEASISRFSIYRVRPDLDTFMSIQTLNPFVQAVLTKHPEDLTALQVIRNSAPSSDDDDDTDKDDNQAFEMNEMAFMSEESFSQITCPRTITYTSDWLNIMGFDKSGSDQERELLGNMFTNMTEADDENILRAAIEAHVGETTFADHLFDEIQTYFHSMLSATHTSSQPTLSALRPKQEIINQLYRTTSVQDVENLISNMTEKERVDTLIWLTEMASTKEVNNNQAVTSYMTQAPHQIQVFDNAAIQNLMMVLPHGNRVSKAAVKAMLDSSAPVIVQWKPMIASVIDQD